MELVLILSFGVFKKVLFFISLSWHTPCTMTFDVDHPNFKFELIEICEQENMKVVDCIENDAFINVSIQLFYYSNSSLNLKSYNSCNQK